MPLWIASIIIDTTINIGLMHLHPNIGGGEKAMRKTCGHFFPGWTGRVEKFSRMTTE